MVVFFYSIIPSMIFSWDPSVKKSFSFLFFFFILLLLWTNGNFNLTYYKPLSSLTHFDAQIATSLANGSHFKLSPMSF